MSAAFEVAFVRGLEWPTLPDHRGRAALQRRDSRIFLEGHGFSRAAKQLEESGFSPGGRLQTCHSDRSRSVSDGPAESLP